MAEKYPDFSPYSVCGNNPLKIVDPSGKYWVNPGEAEKLEANLSEGASRLEKKRKILEELEKRQGLSDKQRSELNDVIGQIDYIRKSIDAINQLGNDPNMFFFDQRDDGSASYVYKDNRRYVGIAKTSDATAVHEIIHISQSINAGGLVFDKNKKLYNAGIFMSDDPREQALRCAENEREAYKAQYAADRSPNKDTLPSFLGRDGINGITIEKIGNLHNGRGYQYQYIKNFNLK